MATYYVDASIGNDTYTGTATTVSGTTGPWASVGQVNGKTFSAGDQILFNGGQTWAGSTLTPPSSGSSGNPITFGSYGTGQPTFTTSSAIACSKSHIVIENFIVTGPNNSGVNTSSIGILVEGSSQTDITVSNCTATQYYVGIGTGGSGLSAVVIENCTANGNFLCGIYINGSSQTNMLVTGCTANNNLGTKSLTGNWSGSGIAMFSTNNTGYPNAGIWYCSATNNGQNNGSSKNGPVGIWAYESTGVYISHCVSYGNKSSGGTDGDGIDLDGACIDCVVEYCLSYNNYGSGCLLDGYTGSGTWYGNIVRYNIFWGNGTVNTNYAEIEFAEVSGASDVQIYGNTVISENSNQCLTTSGTGNTITNNIFYKKNSGTIVTSGGTTTWSNNCYYSPADSVSHPTDAHAVTANPLLVTPGTMPTQTNPTNDSGADGMQLQSGSPCIGAGASISGGDGGFDYFGTATSSPYSIGAYYPASAPSGPTINSGALMTFLT
jgi:hypothetical protein